MESAQLIVETNAAEATRRLGEIVARLLPGAAVLALAGDLGAGKTTFVQGLGRGLGVGRPITSPTFVLINRYRCTDGPDRAPRYLQHADCYRLSNAPLEMWDAGLSDLMWGEDIVVVEWADRVEGLLPPEHLEIAFAYGEGEDWEQRRRLIFTGRGAEYARLVRELETLTAEAVQ